MEAGICREAVKLAPSCVNLYSLIPSPQPFMHFNENESLGGRACTRGSAVVFCRKCVSAVLEPSLGSSSLRGLVLLGRIVEEPGLSLSS